ncbi:NAD-dependent epimerase/dehydratase family protein [Nakamurella leprariae]
MSHVLVTGGSGFIAGHVIVQLLGQGHTVRTTVRSLAKEDAVRAVLREAGLTHDEALSFVEADLVSDAGWAEAVRATDFVIHVASPIHTGKVKDEDEVIAPARDGALRVLRAARNAGVRRLVLTSAFHAVGFGHGHIDHVFTEDDWSPLDGPGVDVYGRSKILAEQAAWDFIAQPGSEMELTTILPVAVMGPVMGSDISGANHIIQSSLNGDMPGYPNMFVPIVDVRDVAAAHVAAMTAPGAAGQRFLIGTGEPAIAMKEIGAILRSDLGTKASKVPTRSIPDFIVKATALFRDEYKSVAADLGYTKRVSNDKARTILDLTPRPAREAITAAGRSMIDRGLAGRVSARGQCHRRT